MIKIHDLSPPPGASRRAKRVGRGTGGRGGKTAGRGTKGQRARDTVRPGFEGGQMPLKQRVPKLKGFKNPFRVEYCVVNLDAISEMEADAVDPEALRRAGLVPKKGLVKVLGRGELSRPVRVEAHAFSASARQAIEGAGGQAVTLEVPTRRVPPRGNALTNR